MKFPDRRTRKHLVKEFFTHAHRVPYAIDHFTDAETILDLGANVGMFSLLALAYVRKARVIAVEPDPAAIVCLRENLDGLPVEVCHMAVGDGRFAALSAATARKPTIAHRYDSTDEITDGVRIPSCSLWEIANSLDIDPKTCFVKIDCEGAENCIVADGCDRLFLYKCLGFAVELHWEPEPWKAFSDRLLAKKTHRMIYTPHRWRRGRHLAMRRVDETNQLRTERHAAV